MNEPEELLSADYADNADKFQTRLAELTRSKCAAVGTKISTGDVPVLAKRQAPTNFEGNSLIYLIQNFPALRLRGKYRYSPVLLPVALF
jgi:hypothetical protein